MMPNRFSYFRTLRNPVSCMIWHSGRANLSYVGMVEQWVQRLVDGMQGTMKAIIKRAARSVNELSLEDFLFDNPAQVALLGLQFQWTADTQVCPTFKPLSRGALWQTSYLAPCLSELLTLMVPGQNPEIVCNGPSYSTRRLTATSFVGSPNCQ